MRNQMETVAEQTNETTDLYMVSEDTHTASDVSEAAEKTIEADELTKEASKNVPNTASGNAADEGVIFTPVYNGAVTPVKASDTERVTALLQKGMKFENMAGDLEKLHQLTAAYGAKTTTEMLDRMLEARENAVKEEYIRKYGNEAGERLYELEKDHQAAMCGTFKDADEAADKASRTALNERLANEFVELRTEHPAIGGIKDLPKSVIDMVLQKGISLLDAYNRYVLKEQKRTVSAAQKQVSNQMAAVGSLADKGGDVSNPVTEAMLRGIWKGQ